MKETLKAIYREFLVEPVEHFDFDRYYYFIDEHQQVFGILKDVMTLNEKRLVESHYDAFDPFILEPDGRPIFAYLFGQRHDPPTLSRIKYYFIRFFTTLEEELERELYTVLVDSFEQKVYMNRSRDALIIVSDATEDIDFNNLLASLEADFMVNLIGFESDALQVSPTLPERFQFDFHTFMTFKDREGRLITKADLIKHHVFSHCESINRQAIKRYVLQDFYQDSEMLKVIASYFEANFNVTLAAKQCYMHRNTFQNKLDKFIAETNFNIREYNDAFIVYLALQL